MRRSWKRALRAQWRDARVLFNESKTSIFLFLTLVLGGALFLRLSYTFPDTGERLTYIQAAYAVFGMIFLKCSSHFPMPGMSRLSFSWCRCWDWQ